MLSDVVGQVNLKKSIQVAIDAAKYRSKPLGHILLSGKGGVGKTHLLKSICKEMGSSSFITQGSRLRGMKDVKDFILSSCESSDIVPFLIIDEIHEMSSRAQEELYYPMDSRLIVTNTGSINLPPFTLAGATTAPELLDGKSLINRFDYRWVLEELSEYESLILISLHMERIGLICSYWWINDIAKRCRGLPRLAIKYADRISDYTHSAGRNYVTQEDVKKTFRELKIDEYGIDEFQRKYLDILFKSGKPLGLDSIANMLNETNPEQVKRMIEPYMWKLGFVKSSSAGREITEAGKEYLSKDVKYV